MWSTFIALDSASCPFIALLPFICFGFEHCHRSRYSVCICVYLSMWAIINSLHLWVLLFFVPHYHIYPRWLHNRWTICTPHLTFNALLPPLPSSQAPLRFYTPQSLLITNHLFFSFLLLPSLSPLNRYQVRDWAAHNSRVITTAGHSRGESVQVWPPSIFCLAIHGLLEFSTGTSLLEKKRKKSIFYRYLFCAFGVSVKSYQVILWTRNSVPLEFRLTVCGQLLCIIWHYLDN